MKFILSIVTFLLSTLLSSAYDMVGFADSTPDRMDQTNDHRLLVRDQRMHTSTASESESLERQQDEEPQTLTTLEPVRPNLSSLPTEVRIQIFETLFSPASLHAVVKHVGVTTQAEGSRWTQVIESLITDIDLQVLRLCKSMQVEALTALGKMSIEMHITDEKSRHHECGRSSVPCCQDVMSCIGRISPYLTERVHQLYMDLHDTDLSPMVGLFPALELLGICTNDRIEVRQSVQNQAAASQDSASTPHEQVQETHLMIHLDDDLNRKIVASHREAVQNHRTLAPTEYNMWTDRDRKFEILCKVLVYIERVDSVGVMTPYYYNIIYDFDTREVVDSSPPQERRKLEYGAEEPFDPLSEKPYYDRMFIVQV